VSQEQGGQAARRLPRHRDCGLAPSFHRGGLLRHVEDDGNFSRSDWIMLGQELLSIFRNSGTIETWELSYSIAGCNSLGRGIRSSNLCWLLCRTRLSGAIR